MVTALEFQDLKRSAESHVKEVENLPETEVQPQPTGRTGTYSWNRSELTM